MGDRATDDPLHNSYLTYMALPSSRIWMRVRARAIKGVKVNNKRSFNNLACRFCEAGTEESQEHLEECEENGFEGRNLDMTSWKGKVTFWKRMTAKFSAGGMG